MKTYDYSKNIYEGRGEGFFFSTEQCALSFFRYPNTDDLRGIGLHVHPHCDDIDILVEGKVIVFNSWQESQVIKAPAIIANLSGVPHSIISVEEEPCLTYGLRSPFKGGEPVHKDSPYTGVPSLFHPDGYATGSHLLFESEYTVAFLHKNTSSIPARPSYHSRTIINLASELAILVPNSRQVYLLKPKSNLHGQSFGSLELVEPECLLVELIAKGSEDAA